MQCWKDLPRIDQSRCRVCASPWNVRATSDRYTCLACRDRDWQLVWIDSWGHYRDGLEKLLHAFKFGRHDFLARPLGDLLHEVLDKRHDTFFDAIVPVPMHPKKMRRRGYNQAELLASALHRTTGIPVRTCLRKRVDNETQSRLPKSARADNVRDVFVAGRGLDGERFLLVDDICTTGETLAAAARALSRAGAGSVSALTVARA
ncbi:MAG: ComF family protein [Acidobacteria bacterium]|nr:ComF family protein [Acidobacteriota bacterium]